MLFNSLQIVFWASVALVGYVYVGYPAFVWIVGRFSSMKVRRADILPTVSMIITAYNEELALDEKLNNSLNLDYPAEKFELIVASDCSNDKTDEIAKRYADRGVRLIRQETRRGKTAAQNLAFENANNEILLFSDATSMYEKNAIREIVKSFHDESVGCVAGKLVYVDPSNSDVGSGAKSYWNYETFLKQAESQACSLIGVSGCIYAVRKSAYRVMYPEACSDFLIATVVYRQGLKTVYEPAAICRELTNQQSQKEMRMRIRVIAQTFTDLWRNADMLNPLKSGFYAIELFSHKVLRYSLPIFLITAFLTAGLLAFDSTFYLVSFALQVGFYVAAFAAWLLGKYGRKAGVFVPVEGDKGALRVFVFGIFTVIREDYRPLA